MGGEYRGRLLGVVLAGGQSRRMGTDKAVLRIPSGQTWLQHSFELLVGVCGCALVATSSGLPRYGYPCIADFPGPEGPARGVAAGLAHAKNHGFCGILVLPCDVPHMQAEILLEIKTRHLAGNQYMTANVNRETGRIEMLTAAYSVAFLPLLEAGLQMGVQSLFQLVPPDRRNIVEYGPEMAAIYKNCNRPEDFALENRERQNKSQWKSGGSKPS